MEGRVALAFYLYTNPGVAMTISQTVQVKQTRNSKYQKAERRSPDEPIYTIGFQNCSELAGKTIRVTVEVID
jgi:hypothetical protein